MPKTAPPQSVLQTPSYASSPISQVVFQFSLHAKVQQRILTSKLFMKKNTLFLFFSQNFCLHLQAKLLITPVFYTKGYAVSPTPRAASRHLRSQWHHHCEAIAHTPYNNTPAPHSVIEQGAGFFATTIVISYCWQVSFVHVQIARGNESLQVSIHFGYVL